ncbi:hypothetical protein X805_24090 [Sphaerotilus natans subsp. natans DSM 6575]|uniref:DdrB-like domain-containing protein n=1 Tax=Sphaerotilus natans subsp. natans DSM 6575 TaxID=1286631 RepID=A0A059KLI8_9BURK|nr:hypothetical protein [Sphaerotilus natans]KDB52039.1 hypothetical protein X805_24090 [Sphaerotilus natans subsp. natans DSM 6575]SIQ09579.1 hypothetical protein SAMN05421778_101341 [Sphaerotilus natans]
MTDLHARIHQAAHTAATGNNTQKEPTAAQQAAGNYRVGRLSLHGLKIAIENPAGTFREGVGYGGKPWRTRLAAHYGYFVGTRGADGDPVDVFIGPVPESPVVWVVNQVRPDGSFDEHKFLLGFPTEELARAGYTESYSPGWRGLGGIVKLTVDQLRWWLASGDKSKPINNTAEVLAATPRKKMTPVTWDRDANPVGLTPARVLYEIRLDDVGSDLLTDPMTMDDLMDDPDIECLIRLDALVVEAGMLKPKMDTLMSVMTAAGKTVQPQQNEIGEPVRSKGTMLIPVIFGMSDGQTVTIWLHNPDTTPDKLAPTDALVSCRWQINKADVTIVVAPEKGRDLNVRDVARRIMKLVEQNSAAFTRKNERAAQRAEQIDSLRTEIAALESRNAELDAEIGAAEADQIDRLAKDALRQKHDPNGEGDSPEKADFIAAREFFRANLQGRSIPTVIGPVEITGASWREMKRGMTSDPIKLAVSRHVEEILTGGRYDGKEGLNKARKDDFVAFHFFEKEVDIGDLLVTAGVTVAERKGGGLMLAYGLGHEIEKRWQKRKGESPDLPQVKSPSAGDSETTGAVYDSILGESVDEVNEPGLHIVILGIRKKDGSAIDQPSKPDSNSDLFGGNVAAPELKPEGAESKMISRRDIDRTDEFSLREQSDFGLPPFVTSWTVEIHDAGRGPFMELFANNGVITQRISSSGMDYLSNRAHAVIREASKDFALAKTGGERPAPGGDLFGGNVAAPELKPEGAESKVKTAKGTQVLTGYSVIEADRLITSHDPATGDATPAFPAELQPRDRGRDASIAWVRKTAQDLDPDLLGKSRRADSGAPIVGPDGVVESGNGRTMAIVLAYQAGKAGEYRAWLEEEAASFGLPAERVKAMKRPVLVRIRTSQIDRAAFAVEANQDDKLAMTATEVAKADAGRLTDDMVALMTEDGDLTAAANVPFLAAFLRSLGDTEAARYSTSDGKPTASLIARVQAAIFAKAYNDDRLLELTADVAKPEIANIVRALNHAAPEFIQAAALDPAATGNATGKLTDAVQKSLNQKAVDALLGASNVIRQAKDAGQSVEEFVSQSGLFGDIDPDVAAMAVFIAKNNRSAKRMGEAFKAMATFIRGELQRRQTADMFGDNEPLDFKDIVAAANRELERLYGEGAQTIGLFDPQLKPEPVVTPTNPHADALREVVAGLHDKLGPEALLAKIEAAVMGLQGDAKALPEEMNTLGVDAIRHWVKVEEAAHG